MKVYIVVSCRRNDRPTDQINLCWFRFSKENLHQKFSILKNITAQKCTFPHTVATERTYIKNYRVSTLLKGNVLDSL